MSKKLLTEEQDIVFREVCIGRTASEIVEEMKKRCDVTLTIGQVRGYKSHNKITSGVDCKFKKGELSDYDKEKIKNIGDTFISQADGYHYIKVGKNKWVRKHRYIYEQYHNVKLNTNQSVIFLDGNKDNFNIDNLKVVDTRTKLIAKNNHLFGNNREITETGLLVSELILKTYDKKKYFKKM